jgi:hypothetical protein
VSPEAHLNESELLSPVLPAQRTAARLLALVRQLEEQRTQPTVQLAGKPSLPSAEIEKWQHQINQQLEQINELQAENARLRQRQHAARQALGALLVKIETAAQAQAQEQMDGEDTSNTAPENIPENAQAA